MPAKGCLGKVTVGVRHDGTPIEVKCGSWWAGEQQFCTPCEQYFQQVYPQGWVGYPGDVCRHGHYVGGCGVDYMCPHCENGE